MMTERVLLPAVSYRRCGPLLNGEPVRISGPGARRVGAGRCHTGRRQRIEAPPQRVQHVAQVTLRTKNNNLIRAEVANADLLAAVDEAVEKLQRQIERYKGRFYQRKKGKKGVGESSAEIVNERGAALEMPAVPVRVAPPGDGELNDQELGEIVRVKRFEGAAADGSPPAEHFVMDMVVESRRAP